MKVSYAPSIKAHEGFNSYLEMFITSHGLTQVCEVGGGANPSLSREFIKKYKIEYTLLDISGEELRKAPKDFKKIEADISAETLNGYEGKFDFMFSRMVAEHIKRDEAFHTNIYKMLKNGGYAFHFMPTLWTLPYFINLILPEKIAYKILLWIDPNRKMTGNFGKFPAYYNSCRGPTKKQIGKLKRWGYDVVEYIGYYGHGYYYRKVKFLEFLHEKVASYLLRNPISHLTSYAYLVLQKKT